MSESDKLVYFTVMAEDGVNHIMSESISDAGLADYKVHPEAFFGSIQNIGGHANNIYELFEFFLNCHRQASKERLLELMKDAPDIEALRKMKQMDLAIEYAERCVAVVPGWRNTRS